VETGHFDTIAIVELDLFLTVGREEGLFVGVFRADTDRDLFIRPDHQSAEVESMRTDRRNKERFEFGMDHGAPRGQRLGRGTRGRGDYDPVAAETRELLPRDRHVELEDTSQSFTADHDIIQGNESPVLIVLLALRSTGEHEPVLDRRFLKKIGVQLLKNLFSLGLGQESELPEIDAQDRYDAAFHMTYNLKDGPVPAETDQKGRVFDQIIE
jgi:hypothetical protein